MTDTWLNWTLFDNSWCRVKSAVKSRSCQCTVWKEFDISVQRMIDPAHVYLQSNCIYTDAFKATHLWYFTPRRISQSVQNVLLGSTRSPVDRNWEKTFTLAEEDKSNTVALELVNSNDSQIEEISFWPVWFYRYNWIEYVLRVIFK